MKLLKDSTYNGILSENAELKATVEKLRKELEINDQKILISPTPSSSRDLPQGYGGFINGLNSSLRVLPAEFEFEVIPLIRKLAKVNPDVSQALDDFTKLANTGHKIKFDPSVGESQVEDMREMLENNSPNWHMGALGMGGITNKLFQQAMIGGATSVEWIPNMDLNNLEEVRFVNPEQIRFVVEKNSRKYQPYQKLKNMPIDGNFLKDLKKLNPYQYKYTALNGDTDLPYGTPPYLAALPGIEAQSNMLQNIRFIVQMLGILGYLDARVEKPDKKGGESDEAYEARLETFLNKMKERVSLGLRNGVNVGFKEDHEFDFKTTAPSAQGVKDLFEQNELLIASGLKYSAIFMGRPGSTETLVTVMFTKMLAQLKNIQDIVGGNLKFGYSLALTLAGFKFKRLSVEFNRSTITDDLKYQQAQEVKIRNLEHLYDQGIVGQDDFADAMDYIKPNQPNPRVTRDKNDSNAAVKKQAREKSKDASDRRVRDKNAPQGTIRQSNNTLKVEKEGKQFCIHIA